MIPSNLEIGGRMRTSWLSLRVLALFAVTTLLGTAAAENWPLPGGTNVYVSPLGDDHWTGLLPEPNRTGTDGPFRTFDRARLYVQTIDRSKASRIDVFFRKGIYQLTQPEYFTKADSGTPQAEVAYQNFPGEEVVISGGMRVTGWVNTTGNIWVAGLGTGAVPFENLYYNGERRLRPRLGNYLGATAPDGIVQAQWNRVDRPYYACKPSKSCNGPASPKNECSDDDGTTVKGDGGHECFDRFYFDPDNGSGNDPFPIRADWKNLAPQPGNPCNAQPGNSNQAGDIELLIFEQFNTSKLRVNCVDIANKVVYLDGDTTGPKSTVDNPPSQPQEIDFSAGSRYIVENVEDSLSLPGQWFLDISQSPQLTLTYLARDHEDPNRDLVIVPQASQLIVAYDLHYVTFRGLVFEYDNYVLPPQGHPSQEGEMDITSAISFQNSTDIVWDSNVVRRTAGGGLDFTSCVDLQYSPAWCKAFDATANDNNVHVANSSFYDLGVHGIRIGNLYTPKDTVENVPNQFDVSNNVVEGYGRVIPSSFGIAQGNGHHNAYTHNDVYDGYHCAISLVERAGDNNAPNGAGVAYNTVAFNHVHHLLQGIMNDGGSIRIESGNRYSTPLGNSILNNKIHDTTDASIIDPNGYGGDGIYLDNQTGNVDVENNLVYRVSGNAVYTPKGPSSPGSPNIIRNNILAFARHGILAVNSPYQGESGPPWSARHVFDFNANIAYFDRFFDPADTTQGESFTVVADCTYAGSDQPSDYGTFESFDHNLYWRTDGTFASDGQGFHVQIKPGGAMSDPAYPCTRPDTSTHADFDWFDFEGWADATRQDRHSVVRDPHFVAPRFPSDDYRFRFGPPVTGFVPFDANVAGRRFWPGSDVEPPAIAPTFATKMYDPMTDF